MPICGDGSEDQTVFQKRQRIDTVHVDITSDKGKSHNKRHIQTSSNSTGCPCSLPHLQAKGDEPTAASSPLSMYGISLPDPASTPSAFNLEPIQNCQRTARKEMHLHKEPP